MVGQLVREREFRATDLMEGGLGRGAHCGLSSTPSQLCVGVAVTEG